MQRIWLIGASEGIGRALAIKLAESDDNILILSSRNHERLELLSQELANKHIVLPMDVCNQESVENAQHSLKSQNIDIDIIIYCAGYYKPMSSDSIEIPEVEKMINVNLLGAMRAMNVIIPEFVKKKQGHIILIGSVAGYIGLPNSFGYGPSKAGAIHLAENLKCDLLKYNIKVQVINPGFVKTRLTALNQFQMPSIVTPEKAASYIVKYMNGNSFETRFPFIFANILKLISKLPYFIYFKLANLIKSPGKRYF